MLAPKANIPCAHCRNGYRHFLSLPDYNVDIYICTHTLPQFVYLVHNAVNRRLSKPQRGGLAPPFNPPIARDDQMMKHDDGEKCNQNENDDEHENEHSYHDHNNLSLRGYGGASAPPQSGPPSCECGNPRVYQNNEWFYKNGGKSGHDKTYVPPYKKSFLERKSSKWCSSEDIDSYSNYDNDDRHGDKDKKLPKCHQRRRSIDDDDYKDNVDNRNSRHDYVSESVTPYERLFWLWIETIAFNFPSDIQLADYWNGTSKNKFSSFTDKSKQGKELKMRLKTYILFFDLLKNFIDRSNSLHERWIKAYFRHTPSPMTFSSRTKLLLWILEMQKACGYDCDFLEKNEAERKNNSFVRMLEDLHPTRAVV
jgi:hypothetical protein